MSDSLKNRLSSHSNSFDGLLSLIPARYYYDDETNAQWKRNNISAEERKAESKLARQKKFDPEVGSSALDELRRREQLLAGPVDSSANSNADDDSDVVIYDDNGNPLGGKVEESVNDLLRAKSSVSPEDQQKLPDPEAQALKKDSKPKKTASKPAVETPEPPITSKSSKQAIEKDSEESKGAGSTEPSEPLSKEKNPEVRKATKPGIEELRAKLAAKVNEMRAKRKAPGSHAQGAPQNREELLAARKLKLEQRRLQAAKGNNAAESSEDDDDDRDNDEIDDDDSDTMERSSASRATAKKRKPEDDVEANLIFGQVQFGDGAKLGKDGASIEEQQKRKKRNAIDQLRVLENRKAKISKLDEAKQKDIAENAKWSRAILQSEGARIRDDEKLLRKTIKQKQNRKKRSEKEWKQRIYNVKKGISDREAKRHANIAAHKEAKKLRLKGRKRKEHMKAAASNHRAQK